MRLNRFSERAFKNIKKEKDLMNKKIVVISTSMRANSNSEALAKSFTDGASNEGNDVEFISLRINRLVSARDALYVSRLVIV